MRQKRTLRNLVKSSLKSRPGLRTCDCNDTAAIAGRYGVEGCRQNIDRLVSLAMRRANGTTSEETRAAILSAIEQYEAQYANA